MQQISINHHMKCVRVWEGGRKADQTYFTAHQHGSMEAAYQAAVAYEQALNPACRIGRKKPRTRAHINNTTGIVGVCPFRNKSGDVAGYRAHWVEPEDGKQKPKCKDFSFFRYGNQAFSKSIQ